MPDAADDIAAAVRTVFFLHIPKTAGTSVRTFLQHRYAPSECLFNVQMARYDAEDPNEYRLVSGHAGFEYIPRFRRPPVVITFLRDPIDRAVSAFYFQRTRDDAHYAGEKASKRPLAPEELAARIRLGNASRDLSLEEFVLKEPELAEESLGNKQTRMLSGTGRAAAADLERACRNLESCDFVGLTHRMDESLNLLCRGMGWEPITAAPHVLATRGRPAVENLPPAARAALEHLTSVDAALFRFATELYHQRLGRPLARIWTGYRFALPDAADFTFDKPIHGEGWHGRKLDGERWICWTGPANESWVDLRTRLVGDAVLRCWLTHAVTAEVQASLKLQVNGYTLKHVTHREGGATILEARVPAAALPPGTERARVHFSVARCVRPCDLTPPGDGTRPLGVAFSRIRLTSGLVEPSPATPEPADETHPLHGLLYDQRDLEKLCTDHCLDFSEYAHMNEFHGNASVLKRYAGLPLDEPLPFAVEHAIPYDLEEAYGYDVNCGLPMFLAVHEKSAACYRRGGIPAVEAVGFAHLYAMKLFDRLHPGLTVPKRRGTIVFPDKSTLLMDTDFDREAFAARLVMLPEEFQPVVVCVYWRDLLRGTHAAFVNADLPVVTCGHLCDGDFHLRLHDLCRRFRYACANDIAGSFALSILSGCHFFHLPGGPLTQSGKNEGTFEKDPTLEKADKAECLAAAPFPPQSPDRQRALAEDHAGVRYMRTPEQIARLWEKARGALRDRVQPGVLAFNENTDVAALHGLLPRGIDRDGWVRREGDFMIPASAGVRHVRLKLHLVIAQEAGQRIELRVNGVLCSTVQAPPWNPKIAVELPEDADVRVSFASDVDVQLSNEVRRRAFRIGYIKLVPRKRSKPAPTHSAPAVQRRGGLVRAWFARMAKWFR